MLETAPPKLPLELSIKCISLHDSYHVLATARTLAFWLVIDGKQPAIPENPVVESQAQEDEDMPMEESIAENAKPKGLLLNQLARSVQKTEQVQIKTITTHALSLVS